MDMKPRKALVTGATGHIGSALCRALREDGTEVVAFVRPSSSRRALEGRDVDVAVGDVLDAGALAAAAATCDVVFHAAALFEVSARDEAAVHRVAVEGSRTAIAAAAGFRATPSRYQRAEILEKARVALEARRDDFADA